jgi:hypothetical protein
MPRAYLFLALPVLLAFSGCRTIPYDSELKPRVESPVQATPQYALPVPTLITPAATNTPPCPSPPPPRPAEGPPPTSVVVVANVHKEPVSIYSVRGDQLGFVAQVQPGEAVDVPVSAGAKLAATFSQAPRCVNYAVKGQPGEVWLLRPAVSAPTPLCPIPACQPVTTTGVPIVAQ